MTQKEQLLQERKQIKQQLKTAKTHEEKLRLKNSLEFNYCEMRLIKK